ncbi:MAG: hypothetical protein MJY42_04605 [Bacteroidales bacterium]|nr:hypothetical protein [Bacteroidales bacterium]
MLAKLILLLTLAAGPWVTDMHKDGFSVVWTSGDDCTGFVQLADGQRFYEEYAASKGKKTGIAVTCRINDATPAAITG